MADGTEGGGAARSLPPVPPAPPPVYSPRSFKPSAERPVWAIVSAGEDLLVRVGVGATEADDGDWPETDDTPVYVMKWATHRETEGGASAAGAAAAAGPEQQLMGQILAEHEVPFGDEDRGALRLDRDAYAEVLLRCGVAGLRRPLGGADDAVAGLEGDSFMMTDPLGAPRALRRAVAEVAFETAGCDAFSTLSSHSAAMFASGRTTGVCVHFGRWRTSASAMCEMGLVQDSFRAMEIGTYDLGQPLRDHFASAPEHANEEWLTEEWFEFTQRSIVRVPDAGDYADGAVRGPESVLLPTGQRKTLPAAVFNAGEVYFQPSLAPHWDEADEETSLSQMVLQSATHPDESLRRDLYNNIVGAGAASRVEGLQARLNAALQQQHQVRRGEFPMRGWAVPVGESTFEGASLVAGLSTFIHSDIFKVLRAQWDEDGPNAVDYALLDDTEHPPRVEDPLKLGAGRLTKGAGRR